MSLISTLVILFLPWAIRKLYRFFAPSNTNIVPHPPRTHLDRIATFLLLSCCIFHLSNLLYPPSNFFFTLNVPLDSPSFIIRNNLRDYLSTQKQTYLLHSADSSSGTQNPWIPSSEIFDLDNPLRPKLSYDEIVTKYDYYIYLYDLVKLTSNRQLYALYGESSLLSCDYCSNSSDYFQYYLPSILGFYTSFLVVLGLVTITRRKQNWRFTITITVLGSLMLELLFYSMGSENLMFILPDEWMSTFLFDFTWYLRNLIGLGVSLMVWLVDSKIYKSNEDVMGEVIQNLSTVYAMQKAVQLQQRIVNADSGLRKVMVDGVSGIERNRELIGDDEEVKKVREEAMRRLRLESVMAQAKEFTDRVWGLVEKDQPDDSTPSGQS
ncbi:hypothetical protein BKA69DRAFT_1125764 [Paraphysoderma sedebokerense]|nr:hypothetical protein BKA69DRAFT_1125764 [Paraphysoderma sedebokerense]